MKHPYSFYLDEKSDAVKNIQKIKSQRNAFTWTKLFLFVLIIVEIIFLVDDASAFISGAIAFSFIVFLYIAARDSKLGDLLDLENNYLEALEAEINFLDMNYSDLDKGAEFKDPTHAYSHDLDLFGKDSLFQYMNRTTLLEGKEELAQWLKGAFFNDEQIVERQKAISELSNLPSWRLRFKAIGNINQKKKAISLNIWTDAKELLNPKITPLIFGLAGANVVVILLSLFGLINANFPLYSGMLMLFIVFRFVRKINKAHQNLDSFTKQFNRYYTLLKHFNDIEVQSNLLQSYRQKLFDGENNALVAFQKVSSILSSFDQRSNILVSVLLNAIYLRDLFLMIRLNKWKVQYDTHLQEWVNILAKIDGLNSYGNYQFNHPEFTFPEIDHHTIISAQELGHPSIPKEVRVNNDFELKELHKIDIVTGANMAGKSTFLRTVAINLILAQSGGPVCAESFKFRPIQLFTSMRTTDDLADETSYFHAELLRLKKLIEMTTGGREAFIILDEILKGTNSTDKLNGSKKFLIKLLNKPISGLVATHDLALGKLKEQYPDHFRNICFEIGIQGEDITYDYKLKEGVSQNMNATLLMEQMGLI